MLFLCPQSSVKLVTNSHEWLQQKMYLHQDKYQGICLYYSYMSDDASKYIEIYHYFSH